MRKLFVEKIARRLLRITQHQRSRILATMIIPPKFFILLRSASTKIVADTPALLRSFLLGAPLFLAEGIRIELQRVSLGQALALPLFLSFTLAQPFTLSRPCGLTTRCLTGFNRVVQFMHAPP